jgi:excisionase family DNA binding protein
MRRHSRPNGKFLSIRDAEAEFSIPYHAIYRWVEQGRIPRLDADVTGKAILIRRADLERFLEDHMTGVRS